MSDTDTRQRDRSARAAATRAVPLYQVQTLARPIEPALPQTVLLARHPAQPPAGAFESGTTAYPAELRQTLGLAPASARPRRRTLVQVAAALAVAACAWIALRSHAPEAPAVATTRSRPRPGASSTHGDSTRSPARRPATRAPEGSLQTQPPPDPRGAQHPTPRNAAEHLAHGRYPEALQAYRRLAQASPERGVYAEIAAIIQHRLALRCEQRAGLSEAACPDAGR